MPREKPYRLTIEDRKLLKELKKEDRQADKVMRHRLKDKDYQEYGRKTDLEKDTVKN